MSEFLVGGWGNRGDRARRAASESDMVSGDDALRASLTVYYRYLDEIERELRHSQADKRAGLPEIGLYLKQDGMARGRCSAIRIFPNCESAIRLLGALLMEQDELWSTSTRYVDMTIDWP